jgi:chemotaxis methyl-accepting protein methylase
VDQDRLLEQCADDRFRHVTFVGPTRASPDTGLLRPRTPVARSSGRGQPLDSATRLFYGRVCRAGGLRVGRYRDTILHRRRAACLRALRVPQLEAGLDLVRRKPDLAQRALGALMIGVTSFYRDPQVFDALRPLLGPLAHRRGRLDALSAGCSDGAELYSLAMLLDQAGLLAGSGMWGFDCRPEAIEAARAGVYPRESTSSLPGVLGERYLAPLPNSALGIASRKTPGERVVVSGRLRVACHWAVADVFQLGHEPPVLRPADLILCRNLAIYLTPEAATELWNLLYTRLRPGGLLVVGRAERPTPSVAGSLSRVGPCIYRKGGTTS